MKQLKNLAFILIAVMLAATFVFCEKDKDKDKDKDPVPTDPKHKLYDKWWYNPETESRGHHYFHENGTLEVDHPFMPDYTGTFQWYPSGDSMLVTVGESSIAFLFKEIEDHTMKYAPGNEPLNIYTFTDTEP